MRIIESEADIAEGLAALKRRDRRLRAVHALAGDPPLRRSTGGFEGLAGIIVSQQLSVASANAIWTRFRTQVDVLHPQACLALTEADFRMCGLSAPKIKTLRAVAEAIAAGALPIDSLASMPADEAHASLCSVKGIGPWTADIYLMFCLGHADAFAPGDLALQEAVRIAFDLENRPKTPELAEISEKWRPWRGVAARLFWAYYRVVKSREGVT